MTFTVRFSAEAEANVHRIHDWIVERSPRGALSWLDALQQARATLENSANSFGLAAEAVLVDEDLRQILFRARRGNPYRALFVIRANVVHIVSIRGTGQELLQPGDIDLPED